MELIDYRVLAIDYYRAAENPWDVLALAKENGVSKEDADALADFIRCSFDDRPAHPSTKGENTMSKTINLQERFLDKLQQEQKPVTLVVLNGYQMRGRITNFDQYTILLDVDGKPQLVFKSAISTIKEG